MNFEEEITLLIKSRYPLILLDAADEEYVLGRLRSIASSLSLKFYAWSLTRGLRVGENENPFYQSGPPVKMLKFASDLIGESGSSVFVLSDFHKFLEEAEVLRLFKDILSAVRGTPTTIILLGSGPSVPQEISAQAARITGGYPDEREIAAEIARAASDFGNPSARVRVELPQPDLGRVIRALKGLSIQQIRNILNLCIMRDGSLDVSDIREIDKFKKEAFDSEGILEYFGSESLSSIAGYSNLKRWLGERKKALLPDAPAESPPPKGVLLLGVQGCGKSLAAKAAAGELGLPLYRLDLGRLYSKYIGETEENLRRALKTVEKLAPICLWIDEIEKILASGSADSDGGVSKRVLGVMLTWMQERKDKSFITATSNDINNLPPELLRKGRFDEIFFSDLPDAALRAEIIKVHLLRRGLDPAGFDPPALARASEGFSGAEIEQAVISAVYSASGSGQKLCPSHVEQQLRLTRPLSVVKAESVDALRAWARERALLSV